jgi:hypothetical protein
MMEAGRTFKFGGRENLKSHEILVTASGNTYRNKRTYLVLRKEGGYLKNI